MTRLNPLAIFLFTHILLTTAISTQLPGQITTPPPQSSPLQAPNVDWEAESQKNSDAMDQQSFQFRAQLTRLINLDFDGELTIEQYVEMIQEAQGAERLNVLIAEELRDIRLPSCHLRGLRVSAAFEILPRLAGNDAITVGIEFANGDVGAADLITISRDHSFAPDIGTQIYPVKKILETIKPESLLQTLERGIQFSDAGSPKVQIALEAETGLLFVKGTTVQLEVVREVLTAIGVNNIPVFGGGGMGDMGGGMGGMGGGTTLFPKNQPNPSEKTVIE